MKDVINNFKKEINSNGISRSDIKLLEDTLGDKIISANVHINNFTTERSFIGLTDALACIDTYAIDLKDEAPIVTKDKYLSTLNDFGCSLEDVAKVLTELTTVYNEDKKNTLFNLKNRYTWGEDDGNTETVVYDIFSKKYVMTDILQNTSFIKESCGDKYHDVKSYVDRFKFDLERLNENVDVNYEIGGYDTFITMGLIVNKEIRSYIAQMFFTPTIFNGEDLINFLDNSYVHYEYVHEEILRWKDDYNRGFRRSQLGETTYFNTAKETERLAFLTNKNYLTSQFLRIIIMILKSMSNQ